LKRKGLRLFGGPAGDQFLYYFTQFPALSYGPEFRRPMRGLADISGEFGIAGVQTLGQFPLSQHLTIQMARQLDFTNI
jgi:hypothetical protein